MLTGSTKLWRPFFVKLPLPDSSGKKVVETKLVADEQTKPQASTNLKTVVRGPSYARTKSVTMESSIGPSKMCTPGEFSATNPYNGQKIVARKLPSNRFPHSLRCCKTKPNNWLYRGTQNSMLTPGGSTLPRMGTRGGRGSQMSSA